MDFGTIFPASGGLPLPKRAPQRQAYRLMELRRWRDFLGVPINIQPKHFPSSEALSAACVIALRETQGDAPAIRLAHRVLRAVWQDELNPGDPATLATLITEIGLDADAVMKLGADPRWTERRIADTQAALDRGVFGAPSYVIGDEIFWGQDRLDFVDRKLARGKLIPSRNVSTNTIASCRDTFRLLFGQRQVERPNLRRDRLLSGRGMIVASTISHGCARQYPTGKLRTTERRTP